MSNGFSNLTQLEHKIPLEKAREMTKTFRDNKEKILKPEFTSKDILPICETFNKQVFAAFMDNPKCIGIRIYYSMDAEKKLHAIIVGVNDLGEDVLSKSGLSAPMVAASGVPNDTIEEGQRCPPFCPPPPPPP